MKCVACGAENPDWAKICGKCGKTLVLPDDRAGYSAGSAQYREASVDHRYIPGKMKLDYMHDIRDVNLKRLDGLQSLLAHLRSPQTNIDALLQDAASLISRQAMIDSVSIGLRDPKDGLYRYRVMVGFRDDAVDALKRIAYRKEQFFKDSEYVGTDISKQSRLYLAEDNVIQESEQKAFNRPVLLTMKRRSVTDSLEGDYLDVKIWGSFDDLLGWIEISGTRTMQLPDTASIRWIEIVASIIGVAVMYGTARG